MGQTRSLVLAVLAASAAVAAMTLLFLDLVAWTDSECYLGAASVAGPADLDAALRELFAGGWLSPGIGRALFVGPGSGRAAAAALRRAGFPAADGASATACCGLPFAAASFDFALAVGLDRVRVPARVVLEMERVLLPGRVGAVIRKSSQPAELVRAAAPVASLLRFSDVVGARAVNGSAMVVFEKRSVAGGDGTWPTCDSFFTRMPLIFTEMVRIRRGFSPLLWRV